MSIIASDVEISSDFLNLDVSPDMTLNDLKAIVEAETNIPPSAQHFLQNGTPVRDPSQSLTDLGIGEGDNVAMTIQTMRSRRRPGPDSADSQPVQRTRSGNDPESLRLRILGDPALLDQCRQADPELAMASPNRDAFHNLWAARQRQHEQVQREKEEQIALLEADPFNVEAQQKIEEMIRQERVSENLQKAMEDNPECKLTLLRPHRGDYIAHMSSSLWSSSHALH